VIRSRAPNLDDEAIALIVGILDGWSGKLNWEGLIEAVERRAHARYTRQALHKHTRIRNAFSIRKKALAEDQDHEGSAHSPELQVYLQRIARLENENARLEAENQRLLEQFARWAYNAHTRGLDHAFLSQPLPPVNRDQTVRAPDGGKAAQTVR
jgi:hypothetical protein